MPTVHPRVDYQTFCKHAPEAYAGLLGLGKAVDDSGLDKHLTELIKLRVSQINGCAFCIQHHLNFARAVGVEAAKLDLVAAWQDAGGFFGAGIRRACLGRVFDCGGSAQRI